MSQEDEVNAYATPTTEPTAAYAYDDRGVDPNIAKKFRQQIQALGAFWVFIGAMSGVAFGFLFNLKQTAAQQGQVAESTGVLLALLAISSVIWIVLGICTCLKQMWAVYVGLVLSYLSVLGNAINFNVCALVLLVVAILQAHRVISWAKELKAAGVPLYVKV